MWIWPRTEASIKTILVKSVLCCVASLTHCGLGLEREWQREWWQTEDPDNFSSLESHQMVTATVMPVLSLISTSKGCVIGKCFSSDNGSLTLWWLWNTWTSLGITQESSPVICGHTSIDHVMEKSFRWNALFQLGESLKGKCFYIVFGIVCSFSPGPLWCAASYSVRIYTVHDWIQEKWTPKSGIGPF